MPTGNALIHPVVDLAAAAGASASTKRGAHGAAAKRHVRHYLPAGAFARAVLLSGLDAPTGGVANTNPHPVLLKLADHGTLPNRFRSRVKECFVTAAGYGDISSERAYLRLERLSCVLSGGEVMEASVKGYVSGEDGDVMGLAVHLAARVEQAARDGSTYVSSTLRDLLLGGGQVFEDRGEHRLKGIEGAWRLYELVGD